MTEAEWLKSTEPDEMLAFLSETGRLTDRKARLFSCASVRLRHRLTDERSLRAVEAAESFADGKATLEELNEKRQAAFEALSQAAGLPEERFSRMTAALVARVSAGGATRSVFIGFPQAVEQEKEVEVLIADILRDIFGPLPFREVQLEPRLLTANGGLIRSLAQSAYEHRQLPSGTLEPSRLSILADAVEESGCAAQDVLTHLRSPQPHTRGCWAIDALTGKS